MTNIVVVQFSDYVQTSRDKRYNLTCLFRGPGEAVVTSGYIGAGYVYVVILSTTLSTQLLLHSKKNVMSIRPNVFQTD